MPIVDISKFEFWLKVSVKLLFDDQIIELILESCDAVNNTGSLQYDVSSPASNWGVITITFCNKVSIQLPVEISNWYWISLKELQKGLDTFTLLKLVAGDQT